MRSLMYITAIVLAAGKGLRFKSKISKPMVKINSRPIINYSLDTLSKHPQIRDIVVVTNAKNIEDITRNIKQCRIKKINNVILGGKLRQDSVRNGLKAINGRTDFILIHDGVRPFIDKDLISSLIKEAEKSGAAIPGVPVKATIKKVTRLQDHKLTSGIIVKETIDRKYLWEVQTPQVFKKDIILKAYDKFGRMEVTDDAMLLEKMGIKVSIIPSSYNNIKITTPQDLIFARALLKSKVKTRLRGN